MLVRLDVLLDDLPAEAVGGRGEAPCINFIHWASITLIKLLKNKTTKISLMPFHGFHIVKFNVFGLQNMAFKIFL